MNNLIAFLFAILFSVTFSVSIAYSTERNLNGNHSSLDKDDHGEHHAGGHDEHDETGHGEHDEGGHDEHDEASHDEHNEAGHDKHDEDEHDGHDDAGHDQAKHGEARQDEHGHEEESGVTLSDKQITLANISVSVLEKNLMKEKIYAPGEVKENGYTSYIVSPRTASVVLSRHRGLGDHVTKGDPLVTLFSESVADAQAAFLVSKAEFERVEKLGLKTVGGKRFVEAQTDYKAAKSRLKAYGLSEKAINIALSTDFPLGEYTLNAIADGAVLSDDFHQGQRVEAGESLMTIANEQELWVEARLAPNINLQLPRGYKALVEVGDLSFEGTVTQEAHTIDSVTRTRIVRLIVNNKKHHLHPGMFANVFFYSETEYPVLSVPEEALIRDGEGNWTVFVEDHPGEFEAKVVQIGRSFDSHREIVRGIKAGSRVVTKGAFFVASQIAKGGFDPHNH